MVKNWVKKICLKLENKIRYKCRIWFSVIRWSRKTIFEPIKKSIFKNDIFGQKLRWKKFLLIWKIELTKNGEYDSAWSAHHEKLYLSPSKNQFLRTKFIRRKNLVKKISFKLENRIRNKCRIWFSVIRW